MLAVGFLKFLGARSVEFTFEMVLYQPPLPSLETQRGPC